MSEIVKAVLIFLAGQASIFGLEWFKSWNAGRIARNEGKRQRKHEALVRLQDRAEELEALMTDYLNARYLWNAANAGSSSVGNDLQERFVPSIYKSFYRLRRQLISTRSDEPVNAINGISELIEKLLAGSPPWSVEQTANGNLFVENITQLLKGTENAMAKLEGSRDQP